MKSWIFRTFRFIHAWGGITIALLLLLSSLTGSILVWKNEFVLLSFPGIEKEFAATPELFADLASRVEEQFENNEIAQISFPTDNFPLVKVALSEARYAYLDLKGNILDLWVQNERWEEWLYDLHHRLLLDGLGLTIVGLAALAMSILVLAGLISFWPLRRSFRQGLWPKDMSRARLLVSHRNLGLIEALPLLMTLITAAVLAFPEQAEYYLLEPFRGDNYSLDFSDGVDDISDGDSGDWLPAIQRAMAAFPDAEVRSAEVPNSFYSYRVIGLQQSGELHPEGLSRVYIDATEGWMDLRIDSQNQHISEQIYNTAYPLHTGRFDNLIYKVFLTLSGLLVSTLSLLGLISFIKKYTGKKS
jgi:uncharacterized iron-regulated membrane protein